MRVEERESVSATEVLEHERLEQRGLSGAGFSDRVGMKKAVSISDPEGSPIVPPVGVRKEREPVRNGRSLVVAHDDGG